MENRCVICGEIILEGREVCPNCEAGYEPKQEQDDIELK
jgi:RNA polymerase subunit RPABC4/transcription elongation factor Spt4